MDPVIVDQSSWGVATVMGADRVRFIQGMVVGDIAGLAVGEWARTCALSPKGRVMSIFDIAIEDDRLVIIAEPERLESTIAQLSKYAIMDDVEFSVTERAVHRVWTEPAAVWTAPPIWEKPANASSEQAIEVRRIEAGLPRYGVDVTDKNFPFENTLVRLISYDKGCYIGQEPVHRVHAKGQPQKVMRGLKFATVALPELGSVVAHPARDNAGTVTSAVVSPAFGAIGLATLHRTAAEVGDTVTCGGLEATVASLPFEVD